MMSATLDAVGLISRSAVVPGRPASHTVAVPRLIAPDARAHESFLAAMAEFADEGRARGRTMIGADLVDHAEHWHTPSGFAGYLEVLRADEHRPRFAGFVTQTTRWWVEGPEQAPDFIGRIAVRHRLTDELRRQGGHIGYDVRRSRRREGHATAMLRAVLPLAHGLAVDPALITCDATNVASRRVIERNGGLLAEAEDGVLRFWVPTS